MNSSISHNRIPKLLENMILARKFEERCGDAYRKGQIGGFCHLYIGQEAVICGVYEAIDKTCDQITTSYRDHAHILLAGSDPRAIMAELFGRETGVSKGKGGSMHLFDTKNHFYGGHGIVGAQVPIGAGLAFANKYKKTKSVSFVFFGDGACHQGQIYETFNMAKLWNLAVVFILENNEYAMGTSVCRSSSVKDLYKRGEGFGITGVQVDGMDVFAVKSAVEEARKRAIDGLGPTLLEMKTYRYRGHSMSDPAKYRTRDEVEEYREKKDPIENLKKYALLHKIIEEKDVNSMEQNAEDIVQDALTFAENSKEPDLSELYTNVYP